MATIQQFVSTGTESHSFGITDKQGREVGSKVAQGIVCYTESPVGECTAKPGTFLTAYAYASRAGKDFCKNNGAYAQFEIVGGNEVAAERQRMAWIEQKIEAAKQRAATNFS